MKKAITWIVIIIIVIIGVVALGNEDNEDDRNLDETGPIKIGVIAPLSNEAVTIGEAVAAAVTISADEINAEGGINGRQIELIIEDGQCSGKPASDAANKLINADNVVAIIGGTCSAETSAFVDQSENAQIPTVSYCSSAPALTDAGDYFFRTYPSDSFEGVYAAQIMKNDLGVNKVAVLYTNDDWGVGIQETFINEFESLGGEVVNVESFPKSGRDFRTQLAKIKANNPDGIYFPGFTEASIPAVNQIQEIGFDDDFVVFGANAWADPKIWEEVGEAGEGAMYITSRTPESSEFDAKLVAAGATPTLCAPQAYDTVKIVAETIRKVGTKGEDIKNELYKTNYQGGVSSDQITFDENGDLLGAEYEVYVVQSGKAVVKE